ncbi:MAG: hypothetical protein ACKVIO_00185 [Phycisphaerales bacterium]|jgi:hypothetical protein|tara:strand:- start:419 stop:625 length:207 start_codon:yes stop_codon:yes gene_type:complete
MSLRMPQTNERNITVTLKDGTVFADRDITNSPFGSDSMAVVSFWDNDSLVMIPMTEIARVEMKFEEEE